MKELQKLLTREEAAKYLKISTRTLDRYVKAGKLEVIKFAGNVRVSEKAILEFLKGE